jgi:hypothetical protein
VESCCGVAPHTLYARRVGRLFDVCKLVASSLKIDLLHMVC